MKKKTKVVSRKEKRKEERLEKKRKNHNALYRSQVKASTSSENQENRPLMKKRRLGNHHHHGNNSHRSTKKMGQPENKFMEMIRNDEMNPSSNSSSGVSAEDQEIQRLSGKLGVKNGKGLDKLSREYEKDGLGNDFVDFLQDLDKISVNRKDRNHAMDDESDIDDEESMDEATRKELEAIQKEDAEFLSGFDDLPTDDEDFSDDMDESDLEYDQEVALNTMRNATLFRGNGQEHTDDDDKHTDDDEDNEDNNEESDIDQLVPLKTNQNLQNSDDDEEVQEVDDDEEDKMDETMKDPSSWKHVSFKEDDPVVEDIYGRPILKDGLNSSKGKYVPPQRRNLDPSNERRRVLLHKVNGQLNRISGDNIESIVNEFESIYQQNTRAEVNEIIATALSQTCFCSTQLMTPLIAVCASLIASLHHIVGVEVSGYFLEHYVKQFIKVVEEDRDAEKKNTTNHGKKGANILLFIGFLYNYDVVHCGLIYDLFRSLVESFQETDIDILLVLLQYCGFQLRGDDASSLKDMILLIQERSKSVVLTDTTHAKRTTFMLDLIYDLKNNKKRQAHAYDLEQTQKLKKWIGRVKGRVSSGNAALRISMKDLLDADQSGRWWIVGGTWVGRDTKKEVGEEGRLLKLAAEQRMNTDSRRQIFCAIVGAVDILDAFEKLTHLGLKEKKEERDIIRVIMDCCGQEKNYNPYYAHLTTKLCDFNPKYKFTVQLCLWDLFKQMQEFKPEKIYNLALFAAHLLVRSFLSLSCFKVVDFAELEPQLVLFLRCCFETILKHQSEETALEVFRRIAINKDTSLVRDGVAVFFHQHMKKIKSSVSTRLLQRVKQILDGGNKLS